MIDLKSKYQADVVQMIQKTFHEKLKEKIKSEKDKEFIEKAEENDEEEELDLSTEKKKKQSKPHRVLSVKQKIKQDKEQFQKLLS